MPYEIETYAPPRSRSRPVGREELVALFTPEQEPIFEYRDDADTYVLIVSVDDEHCTVSLMQDDTWYWLEESPGTELVEIVLVGQEAHVPAGALVRRESALAALLLADDLPRLRTDFRWREQ